MAKQLDHDPVEAARQYWRDEGWNDSVAGMTVVASITRADQIFLNQSNSVLRPFGLTFARYQVLGWLDGGPMLLGELASHMWLTAATVTTSIDGLEKAGLSRRRMHPDDGRMTLAEITPKGRRVYAAAVEAINTKVFSKVALSRSEAKQLVELIGKIRASVGDIVGVVPR